MSNPYLKTRPDSNPYQIWITSDGKWSWNVLKKYQKDDSKEYARWFCKVCSPFTPEGELGDVYVKDIKSVAYLVKENL